MATTPTEAPAVTSLPPKRERTVGRAALIAFLLALADLLLGGWISIWMAVGAVLYYLPKGIAAAVKKDWRLCGLRVAKGVAVFAIAAGSLWLHAWDRHGAQDRGEVVAAAIERYR